MPKSKLYSSLIDDDYDQGDPNICEIPQNDRSKFAFRYYLFVTDDSDYGRAAHPGYAFPVYGSNDLFEWKYLNESLVAPDDRARWAPCVNYLPDLERPFVMLYSRARGNGEEAHVQHKIRRADSTKPEGPYVDSGESLTENLDFSIDPNIYRDQNGALTMAFATDFVENEPIGTGLARAPVSSDLRKLLSTPEATARATANWQMYDPERSVPWKEIANVCWDKGDRVKWHCLEGPVGGIAGPTGRRFMFYSSGNYSHFYAVGILEELADNTFVDLSVDPRNCLLAPDPERKFFSVGRIGVITGPDGETYASFHARFGSPEAPRRFGLSLLQWTDDGIPFCSRS
jgi:arabinan endo-1,5-alpha-L-arabinosidase